MRWGLAMCVVFAVVGCASSSAVTPPSPFGESAVGEATAAGDGVSAPFAFDVPAGARSITVVVHGDASTVFALASLVLADGSEHVMATDAAGLAAVYGNYLGTDVQRQFPRRQTFAFQYPVLASQPLPPGPATVRFVASVSGATADVHVYVPTGVGTTLHVSLVSFARTVSLATEPPALAHTRDVLAAAGIALVVDERITLDDVGEITLPRMFPEPADVLAPIIARAHAAQSTDALPIILVELANGDAESCGIPVPPVPEDTYYAIIVDPTISWPGDTDLALGRVIAHELAHALSLPHVEDTAPDHTTLYDAFDDTMGWDTTLMGSADRGVPVYPESERLTPEQIFAMTRSALLR